jgi:hypothetical protein
MLRVLMELPYFSEGSEKNMHLECTVGRCCNPDNTGQFKSMVVLELSFTLT